MEINLFCRRRTQTNADMKFLSACVRVGLRLILILIYPYHDIALKKSITSGELMYRGVPGRAAAVFPTR
ncbi:MAG: hypothetical protein COX19_12060 [Desulfobacterales bacterium CG23_combo_of_CG06-09_8_20_14_all_51_8]|nr:MAG: hypothetical protein COX19_12060 [Desulfobacterales bacterium CG23_combo_of_CG06-09_8_20_14_all_51_8]